MRPRGAVRYDAQDRQWVITAEPDVVMKLKRVFGKLSPSSFGEHRLSDTAENARDLEWFLDRYPMTVDDAPRLSARAEEHRERQGIVERLMSGEVTAPPVHLALPLRDYQRQAVAIAFRVQRLLLCDELGLGKSAMGIGIFTDPRALPGLVVTQTHLVLQWERELKKFAPGLRVFIPKWGKPHPIGLGGASDHGQQLALRSAAPQVVILNYHKLPGWAESLAPFMKSLVLDECQEVRLPGSQKYAGAMHVSRSAEFVLGLTGTPIYNQGSELHSVLDVIRPDAMGTRVEFVREWCGAGADGRESVKDPKALGLHVREQGLMLRRTRADVGRELPPLQRVIHEVSADFEALDRVSDACRELALFLVGRGASPIQAKTEQGGKSLKMLASEELSNKLRQATGIAKAPYIAEFVRLLVEQDEKIVLFGWHRECYRIWLELLGNLEPVMFTGSETAKEKDRARSAFIEGKARVLIMSLRAGAGLDGLQHVCRNVVFGELDWAYGVHEQDEGRVFRDGQKHPVVAYYPVCDVGSDPIVLDVLGVKRGQLEGVRDPNGALLQKLEVDPDRIKRLAESYLEQRSRRRARTAEVAQ